MTYMLELKHVSYSYQSYRKVRRELSVQKWGFTALSVSLEQENQLPSLPLRLKDLEQSQEGARFSLMGRDIKGIQLLHRKHHVSLVFQGVDYLTPLENVRFGQQASWEKEILLELGLDETQIQAQCPAAIGGQQQQVAIACARFRKLLSSWQMSRQETLRRSSR